MLCGGGALRQLLQQCRPHGTGAAMLPALLQQAVGGHGPTALRLLATQASAPQWVPQPVHASAAGPCHALLWQHQCGRAHHQQQQRRQQQQHHVAQQARQLHTSPAAAALQHHVQLHRLRPAAGASKLAKRWGRGDGGDRGTYCGRGVKGQKARKGNKPGLLFDGGQKTLKKFPKVWLKPSSPVLYRQLSVGKLLRWVELGLLDATQVITMKDLRDSGCASKVIRWGVELVAAGHERVCVPLHLQVSSVSPTALRLIEAAGGSVTRVYYTPLGLRALLKPESYDRKGRPLPRPVRAWPPRDEHKFDAIGQIPPQRGLPTPCLPLFAGFGGAPAGAAAAAAAGGAPGA